VLSKDERFNDSNNVLLVFWVTLFQLLKDASLNQSLLVQAFLISQYLQSTHLLLLVVEAFENLTERALSNPLLNFIPVRNMVVYVTDILALVIVEAAILRTIRSGKSLATVLALKDVKIVHLVIL